MILEAVLHDGDASVGVDGLKDPPRIRDDENVLAAKLGLFQAAGVGN